MAEVEDDLPATLVAEALNVTVPSGTLVEFHVKAYGAPTSVAITPPLMLSATCRMPRLSEA